MFENEVTDLCCSTCKAEIACREKCECWHFARKGAEFGYNKANEWHKQDNDDIYDFIAKDWSLKYFICIMKDKSLATAIGICDEDYDGGVTTYLDFDHDEEKYSSEDIVWWKEIVPPKE